MRLSNLFTAFLSRTDFYIQQEQILKNYSQGHSNMSYIYINEDNGQVISNDSELEASWAIPWSAV